MPTLVSYTAEQRAPTFGEVKEIAGAMAATAPTGSRPVVTYGLTADGGWRVKVVVYQRC